ncbi:MAG TPA: hypothetical protein PKY77_22065 [Phycisphaerae bacterium]|nr:hypothetical protein [Phycisphaerae bacterium]
MAGKRKRTSYREAQDAFDAHMQKMLRSRAFRERLAALSQRRAGLEKDREAGVEVALEEATRPLADFLEIACGDFAYRVANATGSVLLKRIAPIYREVMGRSSASRPVDPALLKTALAERLREATAKLAPVARSIERSDEECSAELRKLLLPGWRTIHRQMPKAVDEWVGHEFDEDFLLGMAFDWWIEQRSKPDKKAKTRK